MKIKKYIGRTLQLIWGIGLDLPLWKLFVKLNYANGGGRRRGLCFAIKSPTKVQIDNGADLKIDGKLSVGYQLLIGANQLTRILLMSNSTLQVNGDYAIRAGSYVRVEPNSKLVLHSGFMNENVQIICGDLIEIGEDTVIGNDVVIRSDDGHKIIEDGYKQAKPIHIGNHVWIGQGVKILKGVTIGDGCIIAAGAIVTKDIPKNCLAAGVPAKVVKENVIWSR